MCEVTAWLNVLLIGIIIVQVVMRYGFNNGLVTLEELIWHFYAITFMFGMAYAMTNDSHIRVDLVHMKLPRRIQHIIEIMGILFLLLPFLWIIFDHSLSWVISAYDVGEASSSPQGLSHRWIIKSVIPLTCLLIFMATIARLIQEVMLLIINGKEPEMILPPNVSMIRHLIQPQTKVIQVSDDVDKQE
ncbi:MAG: TRAP transporter small permease subunit [Gammaproteobacteria bacterium]|nr:TRAP transporter small permease subunit [Gammaproteobacteria bacterium]